MKTEQKLIGATLAKPHTHAGIDYKAGDTIQVTEPERDWLAKHQIINVPAAAKEKK